MSPSRENPGPDLSLPIGARLKSGALWTYFQGWIGAVVRFATGIALARILDPADFGVFFAVSAYTAIVLMQVQFGIPEALLQAKQIQTLQWDTAFWFMQGISVLAAGILFLLAGALEVVYDDPRYAEIMRWMCLTLLIVPITSVNGTILRRQMRYKALAVVSIMGTFLTLIVSLSAAFLGAGAFTFVISGILGAVVSSLALIYYTKWTPIFRMSWASLKPLFAYGWRIHINNSLTLAAHRVDNMLIGRLSSMHELGIYNRAFSLSRLPIDEFLGRLYQVIFSGLSRIQDDIVFSIAMYQKVVCALASTIYPTLLVLIFVAGDFVPLVYGEKWTPAVTPLQIMAVGGFATVISTTLGSLVDAQGLTGRDIPIQSAYLCLTVVAVIVGVNWGLVGIAVGISLNQYLVLVLITNLLRRSHLKLRGGEILAAVWVPAVATVVGACVGMAVDVARPFGLMGVGLTLSEVASIAVVYTGTWLFLT
ncbi:MAG: lipopolysaccharide biosynthesis protein, partial [Gammaproteobacteria bacterium]|nr:lipopolysaccharide biosynthesis protein [Gammaproteobacteria bacterium]